MKTFPAEAVLRKKLKIGSRQSLALACRRRLGVKDFVPKCLNSFFQYYMLFKEEKGKIVPSTKFARFEKLFLDEQGGNNVFSSVMELNKKKEVRNRIKQRLPEAIGIKKCEAYLIESCVDAISDGIFTNANDPYSETQIFDDVINPILNSASDLYAKIDQHLYPSPIRVDGKSVRIEKPSSEDLKKLGKYHNVVSSILNHDRDLIDFMSKLKKLIGKLERFEPRGEHFIPNSRSHGFLDKAGGGKNQARNHFIRVFCAEMEGLLGGFVFSFARKLVRFFFDEDLTTKEIKKLHKSGGRIFPQKK